MTTCMATISAALPMICQFRLNEQASISTRLMYTKLAAAYGFINSKERDVLVQLIKMEWCWHEWR